MLKNEMYNNNVAVYQETSMTPFKVDLAEFENDDWPYTVYPGQQIIIYVEENPTTGYTWQH